MNDKFLDTNIVIYAQSNTDLRKQIIAQQLIANTPVISTQVVQECINNYRKKLKLSISDIQLAVNYLSPLAM